MIGVLLAIIGGFVPVNQDFVVAFASQGYKHHHCSGTLVAADTVLVARHCIDSSPGAPFEVRFSDESSIAVASVYMPSGGDSALAYLAEPSSIEPAPLLFDYVDSGTVVSLSGWGDDADALSACISTVTWASPESYIQFDPYPTASCGPAAHDSGGGILVREGLEWRTVGNITSTSDGVNVTRYSSDPAYVAVSAPFSSLRRRRR